MYKRKYEEDVVEELDEEQKLRRYLHNTVDVMTFDQLQTLAENLGLTKGEFE